MMALRERIGELDPSNKGPRDEYDSGTMSHRGPGECLVG